MNPEISVITCSHNPGAYVAAVLSALEMQTLARDRWEFLLIDNASNDPLKDRIDISWHPQGRHIHEPKLGLTMARLRGISEARGSVLIFVDDDNVLAPDYIERALEIYRDWPRIGAWGGRIEPLFEQTPPEWTKGYWPYLAVRECDRDSWSNIREVNDTTPCGAGLCVRKEVALKYVELLQHDPRRRQLGRVGNSFSSCEDTDLALTACDLGMGTGLFKSLCMSHVLPGHRLQEDYLVRLVEGISYSAVALRSIRGERIWPVARWAELAWYVSLLRFDSSCRGIELAKIKGRIRATRDVQDWQSASRGTGFAE